jgi:hypothetical protein
MDYKLVTRAENSNHFENMCFRRKWETLIIQVVYVVERWLLGTELVRRFFFSTNFAIMYHLYMFFLSNCISSIKLSLIWCFVVGAILRSRFRYRVPDLSQDVTLSFHQSDAALECSAWIYRVLQVFYRTMAHYKAEP